MAEILTGLWWPWRWASLLWVVLVGCVTDLPTTVAPTEEATSLVIDRVTTVITGETRRIYDSALRFFELVNRQTQERF